MPAGDSNDCSPIRERGGVTDPIRWRKAPFAGVMYGRFARAHFADGWTLFVARDHDSALLRLWQCTHGPFVSVRALNTSVRAIERGSACECRVCSRARMKCTYVYNGRNGGRRGRACSRSESEHCQGKSGVLDDGRFHDDDCKLSGIYGASVQKVHHPFHRGGVR